MIPKYHISSEAIERDICIDLIHISRRLLDVEKQIKNHAKHRNISLGSQIQFRRELNRIVAKCDDIKDLITEIDECQGKFRLWGDDKE